MRKLRHSEVRYVVQVPRASKWQSLGSLTSASPSSTITPHCLSNAWPGGVFALKSMNDLKVRFGLMEHREVSVKERMVLKMSKKKKNSEVWRRELDCSGMEWGFEAILSGSQRFWECSCRLGYVSEGLHHFLSPGLSWESRSPNVCRAWHPLVPGSWAPPFQFYDILDLS